MNILALCCALDKSYFAFEYQGKFYSEIIKSDENYHSLYVISKIKELFKKENIVLNAFDAIAANLGPGSFTGIRVTLSIAKIIASELNLPFIGLNTAEILLDAYEKDYLLMDARRDMYYFGTKSKLELVFKDKLDNNLNPELIVCDKRCASMFPGALCFENCEADLGKTMLKLAKEKYANSKDKSEFNYLNIKANYIQTPPVF